MSRALAFRITRDVELMDAGPYDASEIRDNLADLRRYNRLGGWRLVRQGVKEIVSAAGWPRSITLLDVATGSADLPAASAAWGARRGVEVRAAGLDVKEDILAEARRHLRDAARAAKVGLLQADALRLPHPDRSVDVVISSNFLHHLDTVEARDALAEMRRVARLGVVAADLVRSPLAWWLVWGLTHLTSRNRLTRNDGPLSVRRAFTPAELDGLAREAGLPGARVRKAGPVRMLLTWSVPAEGVPS